VTLDLLITRPTATAPIRVRLSRALTTIGSAAGADVRIEGAAAQWLVVQREPDAAVVCVLASGARHRLTRNDSVTVDGVAVTATAPGRDDEPVPVAQIADALVHVDRPDEALHLLLDRLMAVTEADTGAVIVKEAGSYTVALALDEQRRPLAEGQRLLSDTLVQQVLAGAGALRLDDLRADGRFATVPSVIDLELRAVLAVPMVVGDRVLGALYLGKRRPAERFGARAAADLTIVASMAIPFLGQLRRAASRRTGADGLVGEAPAMAAVRRLVDKVAGTDLGVLIAGETGTGKEVVARALHTASPRAGRELVSVNCAAIPPTLFEAELFGYRKGAFTGAVADRTGRIEAADGSTLFLDEIGDMPLPMQAALLRVLQEREVTRVGDNAPRPVDFRLIAASHRDLDTEVAAGRFRQDLLFRLREVVIELPPLSERGDDVVLLGRLFLAQAEAQLGLRAHTLSATAERALLAHPWPGNVRELRATMRRAAVLTDGSAIEAADLGLPPPRPTGASANALGDLDRPLAEARDAFVAGYVRAVLDRHGGNREAAAAALGISLRSLYRYLE
jgi:transcriptional regulator with GAF, ATPase, and Fis domain